MGAAQFHMQTGLRVHGAKPRGAAASQEAPAGHQEPGDLSVGHSHWEGPCRRRGCVGTGRHYFSSCGSCRGRWPKKRKQQEQKHGSSFWVRYLEAGS